MKFVSMPGLGSVGTLRNAKDNTLRMNVKIKLGAKSFEHPWKNILNIVWRYVAGQCKFKDGCAYRHEDPTNNREQNRNNDKVKELEKEVEALSRKVLSLENPTKNLRTKAD